MINEKQTQSGAYDATGGDLDVHAILQGFLRQFQSRASELITNAEVIKLRRVSGLWKLNTRAGEFEAPVVVNAANG